CEGQALVLQTYTQADGYHWTGPNGFTSDMQEPQVIDPVGPNHAGTYQLVVEVNGCTSAAATIDVTVETLPPVPVLQTDLSVCEGDTIHLETALVPGYTYQWIAPSATPDSDFGPMGNPGNPLWTIGPSTMVTPSDHPALYEAGQWSVQLVSPMGCVSQAANPADIVIHEIPQAPPALTNGPICEGEELLLLVEDMPGATYYWYNGDPVNPPVGDLITTIQNPTLYNVEPGVHQYFLMVEQNGCLSAQGSMVEVEVRALPEVQSVFNTGPYCVGETIQLEAPTIAGATYHWTGPAGFSSFEEDPYITGAGTANAGTYVLTVQNGFCVSMPISTQVLVTGQPSTPIVDNNGPACEGDAIQLITMSVPNGLNVVYEWTGPNGFTSSLQNPILDSLTQADEGAYYLTVYVDGCQSLPSAPTLVEVYNVPGTPPAVNNTSPDDPACEGDAIQLETPYLPGASYLWTGPAGFVSTLANPVITDASKLNEGEYLVQVTVNGCASGENTTRVYVQELLPVPVVVSNSPVCIGDDLVLEVANVDTSMQYTWYDSIGNYLVGAGTQLIFDNAQPLINNTYYVLGEINGCYTDPSKINSAGEDAFMVAHVDVPSLDVAYIGDDLFVCEDTVTVSAIPLNDGTGLWSHLDSNATSFITRPNDLSTLVVNLEEGPNVLVWSVYSGACGITSSDTLTVTLSDYPAASDDAFETGYEERLESSVLLNDSPNTTAFFVELLSPPSGGEILLPDNGNFTYVPDQGFIGLDVFEYQLCNVSCPDDCATATASIEVGFDSPCEVPGIFTPNNDGVNDHFVIPCLPLYPGSGLTVFNRWGDEVFHSDDYQGEWGGTYKGNNLPGGTYFYILKLNDTDETVLKGYVFLQR
ncbi:MAG TPA: gliding motility-associated C-terminal domain-containing protein, partial [Bacteroidetes bacterium]|nr:gliding motility-associated C-terminal domain-containing protein [Bacteroidota bacterium]